MSFVWNPFDFLGGYPFYIIERIYGETMHNLLLTTWLCLPVFPLYPVEQDTIAPVNLHFTVGLSGPNGLVAAGPEVTAKYEMLLIHPVIVRTAFDYRYGRVNSKLYPSGNLHAATVSVDVLYYRGRHKLTGYLGLGVVYTLHGFQLASAAADSLLSNHQINEVNLKRAFGYRIIMGLRFHSKLSLEIGITEVRPKLLFISRLDENSYSVPEEKIRLSDVRGTVG